MGRLFSMMQFLFFFITLINLTTTSSTIRSVIATTLLVQQEEALCAPVDSQCSEKFPCCEIEGKETPTCTEGKCTLPEQKTD